MMLFKDQQQKRMAGDGGFHVHILRTRSRNLWGCQERILRHLDDMITLICTGGAAIDLVGRRDMQSAECRVQSEQKRTGWSEGEIE